MKIVWLASYPKSGNTLMRMILYSYLHDVSSDETSNIENKIPDLHKVLSAGQGLDVNIDATVIVKTHFMFSDAHPYAANTAGFIYILRNPRDVLLSNARYLGVNSENALMQDFARDFINNMGVPCWKEMNMGSWPEHVGSWLSAADKFPSLFVKYEELRENPVTVIEKVAQFLSFPPDREKIRQSIDFSSIDRARDLEEKEKKHGVTGIFDDLPNGQPFVGDGRMNQSLATIGDDIEDFYLNRFGKCINLFGYE